MTPNLLAMISPVENDKAAIILAMSIFNDIMLECGNSQVNRPEHATNGLLTKARAQSV